MTDTAIRIRPGGSEAIADNFAIATHLKDRHPEAAAAHTHMKDLLRNDYGINIEDINRDHPTALVDQHRALRDPLDDHFNKKFLDAEADETLAKATGRQKPVKPTGYAKPVTRRRKRRGSARSVPLPF